MVFLRGLITAFICVALVASSLPASPSTALGTVVAAERARASDSALSAGTTLFGGEHLVTDAQGAMQARIGNARIYLGAASSATLASSAEVPSVTLTAGTLIFSAASANSFELRAADAQIRPQSNVPTVAQVTLIGPKEMLVTSRRGPLSITIGEETKLIPEAGSYRVLLDPPAMPEAQGPGPRGAGSGAPQRTARSRDRILILLIAASAGMTAFALHEIFESPSRP